MTHALLLFVLIFGGAPRVRVIAPWVLEYHCDTNPACEDEESAWRAEHPADYQTRSFRSKQQAIDWAEQNYQYRPENLWHRGKKYVCDFSYLNSDDPDPITRDRKAVTCERAADGETPENRLRDDNGRDDQ
jgi:hypothetical protein